MTLKQMLDYYNHNKLAIAVAIDYTEPAVRHWIKNGKIPFRAQKLIEAATSGKLIARKEKR